MHLVFGACALPEGKEEIKGGRGEPATTFVAGGLSGEENPVCVQQMGYTCMTKPSLKASAWQFFTILWKDNPGTCGNQFNLVFLAQLQHSVTTNRFYSLVPAEEGCYR